MDEGEEEIEEEGEEEGEPAAGQEAICGERCTIATGCRLWFAYGLPMVCPHNTAATGYRLLLFGMSSAAVEDREHQTIGREVT